MKAICINEYVGDTYMELTLGKIYNVVKKAKEIKFPDDKMRFFIINDAGYGSYYTRRVIIPLDEWREKQLNELGI
jgi:hypothetical protein